MSDSTTVAETTREVEPTSIITDEFVRILALDFVDGRSEGRRGPAPQPLLLTVVSVSSVSDGGTMLPLVT
jgi:hypothetical protein